MNQLAIVLGILVSYLVGWALAGLGEESWRWMFAVAAGPSLLFSVRSFLRAGEPPLAGERRQARGSAHVLARLGEAPSHLGDIERVIAEESGSLRQLLDKGLRRPLMIGITLAILQQVTGINTVLYYGSIIFTEQAGAQSTSAALWANVLVGAMNLVFTVVALFTIDRLGRKALLISAATGMGLSLTALGFVFAIGSVTPSRRPDANSLLRRMLFIWDGAGRLGGDLRIVPYTNPRAGDVAGNGCAVASLPADHSHVPFAGEGIHGGRRFLDLCLHVRLHGLVRMEVHA